METSLQTSDPPVNMLSGYVSRHQATLTIYCHDSTFKSVTASDSAGNYRGSTRINSGKGTMGQNKVIKRN